MQFAFGMDDRHPAVAGMVVITGIVGEVMARPRVWPPRRFPRLSVNVELRHEFAAPLTKAIEPGYWLFAAHSVEDIIGENFRNHALTTISEHSNTDATIGQHLHQCTPAAPAASVPHNALSAIAVRAEAEAIVRITVLGEFGCCDMHARCLKFLYQGR
jgi:hypothetical protein